MSAPGVCDKCDRFVTKLVRGMCPSCYERWRGRHGTSKPTAGRPMGECVNCHRWMRFATSASRLCAACHAHRDEPGWLPLACRPLPKPWTDEDIAEAMEAAKANKPDPEPEPEPGPPEGVRVCVECGRWIGCGVVRRRRAYHGTPLCDTCYRRRRWADHPDEHARQVLRVRAYHREHREESVAYQREYNRRNRERLARQARERYWRDPEKDRAHSRRWVREHAEERRAYNRAYYQANRERILASKREYRRRRRQAAQTNEGEQQ